jgi:hypothetical protein
MIDVKLYRVMSAASMRGKVISPQNEVCPRSCPAAITAPRSATRAAPMAAAVRRVRRVMPPA